ncbi:gluconate 2-dehydrogenase subunit 3 family protein [Candidatus Accumulibacter cognatus]|uniref:Uncharacterized protein n=1 Tax=Candidatus Accumulibacter cognatus TaxID=2954383 RepID=A0A080M2F1_9PROT|nr:gluconate 2-dehydrogenase subunit 3 family protein [Candidatus Accumulibacter cognatus]KFB75438.1 MAG: hypothetical protein AW06_003491 [Candidatus Accumulibacter cognatus]QLH48761.1 MAG: hypothetical protein HWD57_02405 [Candidatus Accumulibacter cognatus]
MAAVIAREPAYARLTAAAMAWLAARSREAGGRTFAALPEARRVDIVAAAAASSEGSTPRTFFQATFDDALFHAYAYADARAWTGLS